MREQSSAKFCSSLGRVVLTSRPSCEHTFGKLRAQLWQEESTSFKRSAYRQGTGCTKRALRNARYTKEVNSCAACPKFENGHYHPTFSRRHCVQSALGETRT